MKFLHMPVNLYFRGKPFLTLLDLAYVWMVLPEGLLLLFPFHGMVLGLVLVHLPWVDTSPPDPLLVLTQLALPAPLLGVDLANMDWQMFSAPTIEVRLKNGKF